MHQWFASKLFWSRIESNRKAWRSLSRSKRFDFVSFCPCCQLVSNSLVAAIKCRPSNGSSPFLDKQSANAFSPLLHLLQTKINIARIVNALPSHSLLRLLCSIVTKCNQRLNSLNVIVIILRWSGHHCDQCDQLTNCLKGHKSLGSLF